MATFKWVAPEAIATALTTELNSLANQTSDTTGFTALSSEIDNETDLFQYIDLELVLATQSSARSAGGTVEIWLIANVSGTYPADSVASLVSNFLRSFVFDATTTARRLTLKNMPLPALKFKLQARNNTGFALAASGNTLKYRRHNEQVV